MAVNACSTHWYKDTCKTTENAATFAQFYDLVFPYLKKQTALRFFFFSPYLNWISFLFPTILYEINARDSFPREIFHLSPAATQTCGNNDQWHASLPRQDGFVASTLGGTECETFFSVADLQGFSRVLSRCSRLEIPQGAAQSQTASSTGLRSCCSSTFPSTKITTSTHRSNPRAPSPCPVPVPALIQVSLPAPESQNPWPEPAQGLASDGRPHLEPIEGVCRRELNQIKKFNI